MKKPVIGLFGTCGQSKWRDAFIAKYQEKDIAFYNPNKENWDPEDAVIEAEHLVSDNIILFPILGSEIGMASLSESAFSVMRAITERTAKFTIIYIENVDETLTERFGEDISRKSQNSRKIVQEHLKKIDHSHVYVVNNLDDMLEISLELYKACESIEKAKEITKKVL